MRDPKHLQIAFDFLANLFNRVGLKTNTTKKEATVMLSGRMMTSLSKEAYRTTMESTERDQKGAAGVITWSRSTTCGTPTWKRKYAIRHCDIMRPCLLPRKASDGAQC